MKRYLQVLVTLSLVLILASCKEEPSLYLNEGLDTISLHSEWVDGGAYAIIDDSILVLERTNEIDTSTIGTKEVIYQIIHQGSTYQITRYVRVVDITPPEVTLNLGIDTITQGQAWQDMGVTVIDDSQETCSIVIEGSVDTTIPGTYLITYTVTDNSNNTVIQSRIVTVLPDETDYYSEE
jgi:hypothetical protein